MSEVASEAAGMVSFLTSGPFCRMVVSSGGMMVSSALTISDRGLGRLALSRCGPTKGGVVSLEGVLQGGAVKEASGMVSLERTPQVRLDKKQNPWLPSLEID
jgi:hypothetical protein